MVGAFSTPHLMSIKSYLGFLDFNYVHDRAQRRIENVAARISSRMSWHGLSGAKPDMLSPSRHGSWVSLRSIQATECFFLKSERRERPKWGLA